MRPEHRALHEPELTRVRAQLGAETFTTAWEEGHGMRPRRATGYALAVAEQFAAAAKTLPESGTKPAETPRSPLTPRQQEVATLVARAFTNKEIAAELVITERTAINHVENILTRLGFHSRVQVAAWAAQQGLLNGKGSGTA
jgi:non-specific serine/threonine protein kinase